MTGPTVGHARVVDWRRLDLVDLMALERGPGDVFVGRLNEDNGAGRIFGGQVLGQALAAAGRTVPGDRAVHSLQLTFCAGSRPASAIRYRVETISDGATTSVRSVRAEQGGRLVCLATASARRPGRAFEHDEPPRGPVPNVEACADVRALVARDRQRLHEHPLGFIARKGSVEVRLVDPARHFAEPARRGESGPVQFWIRPAQPLPDDPLLRQCALAYLTDYLLSHVPPLQVGSYAGVGEIGIASINHAFWFGRPIGDGWMLVEAMCPIAAGGRGLVTARVYDADERVVAVTTQECTYRYGQEDR